MDMAAAAEGREGQLLAEEGGEDGIREEQAHMEGQDEGERMGEGGSQDEEVDTALEKELEEELEEEMENEEQDGEETEGDGNGSDVDITGHPQYLELQKKLKAAELKLIRQKRTKNVKIGKNIKAKGQNAKAKGTKGKKKVKVVESPKVASAEKLNPLLESPVKDWLGNKKRKVEEVVKEPKGQEDFDFQTEGGLEVESGEFDFQPGLFGGPTEQVVQPPSPVSQGTIVGGGDKKHVQKQIVDHHKLLKGLLTEAGKGEMDMYQLNFKWQNELSKARKTVTEAIKISGSLEIAEEDMYFGELKDIRLKNKVMKMMQRVNINERNSKFMAKTCASLVLKTEKELSEADFSAFLFVQLQTLQSQQIESLGLKVTGLQQAVNGIRTTVTGTGGVDQRVKECSQIQKTEQGKLETWQAAVNGDIRFLKQQVEILTGQLGQIVNWRNNNSYQGGRNGGRTGQHGGRTGQHGG